MKFSESKLILLFILIFFSACNSNSSSAESCHNNTVPHKGSYEGWQAFHEAMLAEIATIETDTTLDRFKNMVEVQGGKFFMGNEQGLPDEAPVHEVSVSNFYMDTTEVTNAQFAQFIDATGYQTLAEREISIIDENDTLLFPPGSLRFREVANDWWAFTQLTNWKHPYGVESSFQDYLNYPVVHISWYDAMAYCQWAGKRLPTEAEWEYAAKSSMQDNIYPWGEISPETEVKANIWQGNFPVNNLETDGFYKSAPVASYEANAFGLYDMAGNVWEWCGDKYHYTYYAYAKSDNPQGPNESYDPQEPNTLKYVMRGGSFLCNSSYCSGYRTSARMKSTPDSAFEHVGFRCVF